MRSAAEGSIRLLRRLFAERLGDGVLRYRWADAHINHIHVDVEFEQGVSMSRGRWYIISYARLAAPDRYQAAD